MKKLLCVLMCGFILFGCSKKEEPGTVVNEPEKEETQAPQLDKLIQFQETYEDDRPVAVMHTSHGDITLVFFPEEAPKACENFLTHAKDGYYNGLTFHRVINEFMIQGGDPLGNGTGGDSIWGEPFEDEFSTNLFHFRGALAMANAGSNTNRSQFFIVQANTLPQDISGYPDLADAKYREIGGTPWLDFQHTVFGQVISGMEVVDAIAALENSEEVAIINSIDVMTYKDIKK